MRGESVSALETSAWTEGRIADVGEQHVAAPAGGLDGGLQAGEVVGLAAEVVGDHVIAFGGKALGNRASDAPRASGDQDRLVVTSSGNHWVFSFRRMAIALGVSP